MIDHTASRRQFLKRAALATLAGSMTPGMRLARAQEATTAIAGKDRRLIVHNAEPGEFETPLALLREHPQTPTSLLFIRNNQLLEGRSLEPLPLAGWQIEIGGLVDRPQQFDAAMLEGLEQIERELVLQCSGNGRSYFAAAAPVKGAPWQTGAMGNVSFRGVPLTAVFKKLKVEVRDDARFLTAEGRDVPNKSGEADFEHSIPLADALDRSFLALRLNGEPLPAVHGGPVRLITAGFYATMNIKWVSRLKLAAQETTNHHQVDRYRTPRQPIEPGSEFKYGLENSDANWNMRLKSVIFSPLDGETVAAGPITVRGVAWNDGLSKIESVQVSSDGQTWRTARLTHSTSPFAWQPWELRLELPRGPHTLLARAFDERGQTQPLEGAIQWNPAGYGWSGVHAVKVVGS